MSDTALAYAVQNLDLQRLQNEQLTLYNIYNGMLNSGSHAQLCTKALEVIRAREKTNRKIDAMNCDATIMAVCLVLPLLCLPALLKDHDYEADAIATGLHAEHVPEPYRRCGAIPESHRPELKDSVPVIASAVFFSQPPSVSTSTVTESSAMITKRPSVSSTATATESSAPPPSSLSFRESSQTLTTSSPFAVLDDALECAFTAIPKRSNTAPVAKLLQIDDMSDAHVMEEVAHGLLLPGSVVLVLSRAVVDRRIPELLLAETDNAVCWDVFRMEARRVPAPVVEARIALRVLGDGKLVFFTNDWMTVLGGYLDGGIFVLGTFHVPRSGEKERDFILNCYREGNLCRVYYTKAPRGALKLREFFRKVLHIDIKPLPQGEFYDFHGSGIACMETMVETA